jgi:lysophospholipase L1-like esterase
MAPWSTQPVLVVGLGDSVTAGFGAGPGRSYFERLIVNPPDEWEAMKGICLRSVFPNLKSMNLSISGTISMEHLESQLPRFEKSDASTRGVIVMTTGGNDLIHDYGHSAAREGAMYGATVEQAKPWIDRFEKRLDTMMAQIRSRFPGGCQIFIANIFDPTDGVGDIENAGHKLPPWKDGEEILAAYNAAIERVSRTRTDVHLVNVHDAFLGHGIHCAESGREHYHLEDPHYWYYVNLEDPNERGYDAIRRLFLLEISRVFAKGRWPD